MIIRIRDDVATPLSLPAQVVGGEVGHPAHRLGGHRDRDLGGAAAHRVVGQRHRLQPRGAGHVDRLRRHPLGQIGSNEVLHLSYSFLILVVLTVAGEFLLRRTV